MSNTNIVKALAPGGQPLVGAKVLGRVVRSEIGQKPWNLVAVDGTPDMVKAVDIFNRIGLGQLPYAEPQPLNPPAPANVVAVRRPAGPAAATAGVPAGRTAGLRATGRGPDPARAASGLRSPWQRHALAPAYGWPQSVPQPPVPQPPAQSFVVQPRRRTCRPWAGPSRLGTA